MANLRFYNTLTRRKEPFTPLDSAHIRIYACGPTVYDRIHIGNARPVVLFDVLVRLLRHHYSRVTYVRNITDIDDKINAKAAEDGVNIRDLTKETTAAFHQDCQGLGALPPDAEPRATDHIDDMIAMIATLIDKGHAYSAEGHVLFEVSSMKNYGQLSRRSLDEMIAGARVDVAPFKRDAADFVLWKPSTRTQPGWDSPWGYGRPGWHIECSAMSAALLGEVFDIHAGGLDLIFPHHENEIAQSCCAHGQDMMAKTWMHNGYVTVAGEKMSKSLGNFTTVADLLKTHQGEAIRYALLAAHYRTPLDFSENGVVDAKLALDRLYRAAESKTKGATTNAKLDQKVMEALGDDLNTPKALARLHELARLANRGDADAALSLKVSGRLMGLLTKDSDSWFRYPDIDADDAIINAQIDFLQTTEESKNSAINSRIIQQLIDMRQEAKEENNFTRADSIRNRLAKYGIVLEDTPHGTTWRRK
jgi:cysteinyl-tRNA synthetase